MADLESTQTGTSPLSESFIEDNIELRNIFSAFDESESDEIRGDYADQVLTAKRQVESALYLIGRLETTDYLDGILVSQLSWLSDTLTNFSASLSDEQEVEQDAIKTTLDLSVSVLNELITATNFNAEIENMMVEANNVITTNNFNLEEVSPDYRTRAIALYEEAIDILEELNASNLSTESTHREIIDTVDLFLRFSDNTNALHEIIALSSGIPLVETQTSQVDDIRSVDVMSEHDVQNAADYLESIDRLDPQRNEKFLEYIFNAALDFGLDEGTFDIVGEQERILNNLARNGSYLDYSLDGQSVMIEVVNSDGTSNLSAILRPGEAPRFN